jgi:carboxymethylenebutenolidase
MATEQPPSGPAPARQTLADVWDRHMQAEFVAHSPDEAVATMTDDAELLHVPVLTGARGRERVRDFYRDHFLAQIPPDLRLAPVSRTVGADRVVDEFVVGFTHTIQMDWVLPGVPPTGKRVEVAIAAIIQFRDDKMVSEHIYWDQAAVLVQVGLLDAARLPVLGQESARALLDSATPLNTLIEGARQVK